MNWLIKLTQKDGYELIMLFAINTQNQNYDLKIIACYIFVLFKLLEEKIYIHKVRGFLGRFGMDRYLLFKKK